ncbi:MAG: ABC transporter ATP-binding protein [Candidatus Omnitrophica bacterium]|nr:Lipoprotein-releasing system ATP-binding protein LolD [bacterium]NUN95712.1 ABC transporter ATP-binding protein [Candidatus Omnitrophota bacterium]
MENKQRGASQEAKEVIRLENVGKEYLTKNGAVWALNEVSVEIPAHEFVVVRGPSGCGKTTLLLAVGGMLRPSVGKVWVDGVDLYAMSISERASFRADKIGFVFQMFHLIPYLSVWENVVMGLPSRKGGGLRAQAEEWLTRLGLSHRVGHKPSELSAGERQRTAVARALIKNPQLVLADEPTGNLDPENAHQVFQALSEYHRQGGMVLLVTHGAEAETYASRVVRLQKGRIVES